MRQRLTEKNIELQESAKQIDALIQEIEEVAETTGSRQVEASKKAAHILEVGGDDA